jgi:hypothetical protein
MATCSGTAGLVDAWEEDDYRSSGNNNNSSSGGVRQRAKHVRQYSTIEFESDLLLKVRSFPPCLPPQTNPH